MNSARYCIYFYFVVVVVFFFFCKLLFLGKYCVKKPISALSLSFRDHQYMELVDMKKKCYNLNNIHSWLHEQQDRWPGEEHWWSHEPSRRGWAWKVITLLDVFPTVFCMIWSFWDLFQCCSVSHLHVQWFHDVTEALACCFYPSVPNIVFIEIVHITSLYTTIWPSISFFAELYDLVM